MKLMNWLMGHATNEVRRLTDLCAMGFSTLINLLPQGHLFLSPAPVEAVRSIREVRG